MVNQKQIIGFQKEILEWYSKHKRDLPWRHPSPRLRNAKAIDPYTILVSEIMAQQTQLSRVVPKYLLWMKKFPTLQTLAKASTRDVLALWSGLGYNRRALYLKKAAEQLVRSNNKIIWPQTEKELRKLSGIGEYTAGAILCFAFNKQIAVVDTNVKKVIAVHFFKGKVPDKKVLAEIADQLLPKGRAYEWNQALMDYAAAMLKKEKIPTPKQAPFKSSKRFYRGQVVKLLLKKNRQTVRSLFIKLQNNGLAESAFAEILKQMEKDGLILRKKNTFQLQIFKKEEY